MQTQKHDPVSPNMSVLARSAALVPGKRKKKQKKQKSKRRCHLNNRRFRLFPLLSVLPPSTPWLMDFQNAGTHLLSRLDWHSLFCVKRRKSKKKNLDFPPMRYGKILHIE